MVFVSELGLTRLRSVKQVRSQAADLQSHKSTEISTEVDHEPAAVAPATDTRIRSRSGSVPVSGEAGASDTIVTVPLKETSRLTPSWPTSTASSVSSVQCHAAWRNVADRLAAVRGTIMVAVGHDQRVTDLITNSLLLYGQAKRSVEQLRELAQKPEQQLRHVTSAYVSKLMQQAYRAVEQLETYVGEVVSDPVALRKLIDKLRQTTSETRRAMQSITRTRELAERRAYLRAVVRQVQLRLQQLPELSVQERSVREQLQPFAALDAFANLPDTVAEQQALTKTLAELEPLFTRLQDSIKTIMERPLPTEDPTVDDTLQAEAEVDWWESPEVAGEEPEDEPWVAISETEESIRVLEPNDQVTEKSQTVTIESSTEEDASGQLDEQEHLEPLSTPDEKPYATEVAEPDQLEAEMPIGLSQGLGTYRLQRGDTLADLLLGETDAGILPAMVEIPPSYIGTLAELIRAYMAQYRTVRQYLGAREGIDVWAMRGTGHPEISLDHLNDIVMYIAVRNELLSIAATAWERLFKTMNQLEVEADAVEATLAARASEFTPYSVRQRAQGQARGVRWAGFGRVGSKPVTQSTSHSPRTSLPTVAQAAREQVIEQIYQGDIDAYENDLANWIETLFLASRDRSQLMGSMLGRAESAPDSRQAFLALRFSDWYSLLHDTALRFAWLQRQMVPASVWRDWSRQVLNWQRLVQKYPRETVYELPLRVIAELVFIDQSLRPQVR